MTKTAVITGANRGIGLALAQKLEQEDHEIIGICRESSDELNHIAKQVIQEIDLTSSAAIEIVREKLEGQVIDLLINNAGLLQDNLIGYIEIESLRKQMEINAFAPLMLTEALIGNLKQGSKIAFITSRMGSISDNTSGGRYGYRASKAALNAFAKSLALDLAPEGISVAILHPGYVQTRMVNFSGLISAQESATALVERINQLKPENSGTFWHVNGEVLAW